MGAKVQDSGSGFNDEPNVVPMIDVLLVLLIIFMMQIPLSRKAMDVQLPPEQQIQKEQLEQAQSNQIVMELREDGSYAINNTVYPKSQLDTQLHEIYDNRPAKLMFVKTARNRMYQEVIEAMDIARGAGVQVIGFTPPEEPEAGGDTPGQ
jgi:biopolymer transport protein TolR